MRYSEPMKRKGEATTMDGPSHSQTTSSFKRRRRNYQNMIPNGLLQDNGNGGGMRPMGHPHATATALQGSNALLANQAMILAQLQNTLASQQTFLQQQPTGGSHHAPGPAMNCSGSAPHAHPVAHPAPPPDKFTAFGQFLASSLNELAGIKALDLMAKFTVEVVNALREQKEEEAVVVMATTTPRQPQTNNNSNKTAPVIVSMAQTIPIPVAVVAGEEETLHNNNNSSISSSINTTTNHLNNANHASILQQQQSNNNIMGEDQYRAHQF